ncbi:amidohydrolase family protein [Pirellulaceae bacterium SH449]
MNVPKFRTCLMETFQHVNTFAVLAVCMACATSTIRAEDFVLENATIHTVGKAGTLERGSVHVSAGKIKAVGTELEVPISVRKLDGTGKHVIPGLVGVFYPVASSGETSAGESRTVTVGGRTFTVPGGSPAATTSAFTVVSENVGLDTIDWQLPTRNGVTTMQMIAPGYCQSAVVKPGSERYLSEWVEQKAQLVVTLTNTPQSLDLLRNNLKEPTSGSGTQAGARSGAATPRAGAPVRGGRGGVGGPPGTPPGSAQPAAAASANESTTRPPAELTPEQKLWKQVRDGDRSLWLNVNNAATILYAIQILKDYPKAKVVWIANGTDAYQALSQLPKENSTVVLPPQIDIVPNTRNRMNVPSMVINAKIPFAFSLGLRNAELTRAESAPLFAMSIISKTGLAKQDALKAATLGPAELLGLQSQIGSLEAGKFANMIVLDGEPFEAETSIVSVYVEGGIVYEDN